ncbi:hypothetical protein Scep_024343 [Stephania cephalantha]|uniref:Uncharacterized protein n=1 Tax=Stephania cephalantha TaxID=152367 RepID=A0AAP0F3I9_9MAGN
MPVKGRRGGSRGTIAQTTSYRKSKESARSTTANIEEAKIDDLPEASPAYASDVVSSERQDHKSQLILVETSSSDSTKEKWEEMHKHDVEEDENEDDKNEDDKEEQEEEEEGGEEEEQDKE